MIICYLPPMKGTRNSVDHKAFGSLGKTTFMYSPTCTLNGSFWKKLITCPHLHNKIYKVLTIGICEVDEYDDYSLLLSLMMMMMMMMMMMTTTMMTITMTMTMTMMMTMTMTMTMMMMMMIMMMNIYIYIKNKETQRFIQNNPEGEPTTPIEIHIWRNNKLLRSI